MVEIIQFPAPRSEFHVNKELSSQVQRLVSKSYDSGFSCGYQVGVNEAKKAAAGRIDAARGLGFTVGVGAGAALAILVLGAFAT